MPQRPHYSPQKLDLVVTIAYSGKKAATCFKFFSSRSDAVLRADVAALGIPPFPNRTVELLFPGCVKFSWENILPNSVLHNTLRNKIQPEDTTDLDETLYNLSIDRITLDELDEEYSEDDDSGREYDDYGSQDQTYGEDYSRKRPNPYARDNYGGPSIQALPPLSARLGSYVSRPNPDTFSNPFNPANINTPNVNDVSSPYKKQRVDHAPAPLLHSSTSSGNAVAKIGVSPTAATSTLLKSTPPSLSKSTVPIPTGPRAMESSQPWKSISTWPSNTPSISQSQLPYQAVQKTFTRKSISPPSMPSTSAPSQSALPFQAVERTPPRTISKTPAASVSSPTQTVQRNSPLPVSQDAAKSVSAPTPATSIVPLAQASERENLSHPAQILLSSSSNGSQSIRDSPSVKSSALPLSTTPKINDAVEDINENLSAAQKSTEMPDQPSDVSSTLTLVDSDQDTPIASDANFKTPLSTALPGKEILTYSDAAVWTSADEQVSPDAMMEEGQVVPILHLENTNAASASKSSPDSTDASLVESLQADLTCVRDQLTGALAREEALRTQLLALQGAATEERRLRTEAEDALKDVERECKSPFVVPALLEAFVSISKLTTRTQAIVDVNGQRIYIK